VREKCDVGTIAGDDTVLVVCSNTARARALVRQFGGGKQP